MSRTFSLNKDDEIEETNSISEKTRKEKKESSLRSY